MRKTKGMLLAALLIFGSVMPGITGCGEGGYRAAAGGGHGQELKDGSYTVEILLEGGSGRAEVTSPASLHVKNGGIFSIISKGTVNVRRPGDYVTKMIELAGGAYVPGGSGAVSTMNMQMEAFYVAAKEGKYLADSRSGLCMLSDIEFVIGDLESSFRFPRLFLAGNRRDFVWQSAG